jgi:type II secretory pathway pseudopilin PulG
MIQRIFKFKRSHTDTGQLGVTLIETLVVLTVLSGLIASIGVSFAFTLKSYTGEYRSEAVELEASRAALELEYYATASKRIEIFDGSLAAESGNRVVLTQPNDTQYTFRYVPTGAKGNLIIDLPDGTSYIFSTNIILVPTAVSDNVFWTSSEGALSYFWAVDTPSGRVRMGGSTLPGI